jgi:hypothetical protein
VAQFDVVFVVVLVLDVAVVAVIATVDVVVVGVDAVGLGDKKLVGKEVGRDAGGDEEAPQSVATLISTSAQFQN